MLCRAWRLTQHLESKGCPWYAPAQTRRQWPASGGVDFLWTRVMSAPLGRKLPHSIDAEMAFLGCQLLHPDKKLGNGLKHQHFVLDQHGYLFAAIREAQAAGTFFDFEHAKVWMANDDRFTIVGGVGYRLAGCATAVINAEEYAHLIFDLAGKRDLIAIAETLETSAHNAAVCETADVLRARIRKALNANECEFANNANVALAASSMLQQWIPSIFDGSGNTAYLRGRLPG
jgi:replicative DNA helicase